MDPPSTNEYVWIHAKAQAPPRPEHLVSVAFAKLNRAFKDSPIFKDRELRRKAAVSKLHILLERRMRMVEEWAVQLKPVTDQMMETALPHVRHVLKSGPTGEYKHLALWQRLLEEVNSPQKTVLGTDLVGEMGKGFKSDS